MSVAANQARLLPRYAIGKASARGQDVAGADFEPRNGEARPPIENDLQLEEPPRPCEAQLAERSGRRHLRLLD